MRSAHDLVMGGFYQEACDQLWSAYQRTDGVPRPPDFVAGPAAAELAFLIEDLLLQLGCF